MNPSRDCMSEILLCGCFARFRQSGVLSLTVRIRKPAVTCRRNHRRALGHGKGWECLAQIWLYWLGDGSFHFNCIFLAVGLCWVPETVFSLQGLCLQSRPSVIQNWTSLTAVWTSVALLAFEFSESPSCGSSFLHMHNQCQVTVAEQWKGMAMEWKVTGGALNPILTKFNWANPVVDLWTIKSRRDEYGCLSSFLIVPKSVSRWHHLPIQLTHMVCHQTAPNTLWWQQWQLEM